MCPRLADDDDWDEDESHDDDWDGVEGEDDEFLDVEDPDEDEPTIPCPYCRRAIHEESSRCPYCEQYISTVDAPRAPKPWWLIVGVALCLYALTHWMLSRL